MGRNQSFNTQPPEGGWPIYSKALLMVVAVSTHSRPKAAGTNGVVLNPAIQFQHTAARRRLAPPLRPPPPLRPVSTHSRPKAAGFQFGQETVSLNGFQHTAARRQLVIHGINCILEGKVSTHSRPKAAGATASAKRF